MHLGIKNASIEWSDIQSDYLLNTFINQIEEDGFDPETDILVQVGDWHHVRESTNVRILGVSLKIAEKLTKTFKRGVHVILGNHDVYYKDKNDVHSLQGFDQIFENFYIYETPKEIKLGSHRFLMLPWIDSSDKFKETISKYNKSDYIFCHADVKGAQLSGSAKLDHGIEYEDLTDFKRIYSGHIHIRQSKNNVVYVGTPYQMDRGDRGNSKGFYVIDLEETGVKERFIENTASPRFIKFDVHNLLELGLDQIQKEFSNNFVDVYIDHEFAKIFPITQFIDLVKDSGQRSIEFQPYSNQATPESPINEDDKDYEYNIFDVLSGYLKSREMPSHISEGVYNKFKEIYQDLKNNLIIND